MYFCEPDPTPDAVPVVNPLSVTVTVMFDDDASAAVVFANR